MELHEILHHKTAAVAATLPGRIEKKIRGSMNLSVDGAVLYVVKKMLGEDCKVCLNIGVGHGGGMAVALAANCPCVHVGVDPFDRTCELTGIGITRDQAELNINANNPHAHEYHLIQGKPTDKAVIKRVGDEYPVVDLLYIDGNRSKYQARKALTSYRANVRAGGIIVVDGHGGKLKPGARLAREWKTVGILGDTLILERK